ncbi:heme exporter protein CcmB [Balneolales bacterium ANBcel1]|nr:heme exporter protein CcmB [Balneolales bacterium ANBcel1]
MSFLHQSFAVFLKDFRQEWRSRFGLSTVLAFIVSSLFVVLFSLRADQLATSVQSGLLWIIILFASLTALARVFVSESERGTLDLLRMNAPSSAVYAGKLVYNFLFTLIITVVTVTLFVFMVNLTVANPGLMALVLILGASGLAGATTLLGALVSQAPSKGSVFPVLALPLLVPLILLLVRLTHTALAQTGDMAPWNDLAALLGFSGVTISASLVLFDNLWED